MFIYICQAAPCFQFSKKFGRLWLFAGGLWSFSDGLGSFVVVCVRLHVVCGHLWWFAVVFDRCLF